MTRRCETCRWWDDVGFDNLNGTCRVLPPTIDIDGKVDEHGQGVWPETGNADWCGAWSGKFFSGEPAEVLDGGVE